MATGAAPDSPPPPAGPSVIVPPDRAHPRKLSEEFALILREFEVETVTLREVIALLHGRGFVLLLLLIALPFASPVPLPGLSTPFGLIIALIGVRLAFGAKPCPRCSPKSSRRPARSSWASSVCSARGCSG
jgi:hypothetical protein